MVRLVKTDKKDKEDTVADEVYEKSRKSLPPPFVGDVAGDKWML